MYRVRQQDLPFVGSSHQFVGAEHGDVNASVFLLKALPAMDPGLTGTLTMRFNSCGKDGDYGW